jgi:hypothetical protein
VASVTYPRGGLNDLLVLLEQQLLSESLVFASVVVAFQITFGDFYLWKFPLVSAIPLITRQTHR